MSATSVYLLSGVLIISIFRQTKNHSSCVTETFLIQKYSFHYVQNFLIYLHCLLWCNVICSHHLFTLYIISDLLKMIKGDLRKLKEERKKLTHSEVETSELGFPYLSNRQQYSDKSNLMPQTSTPLLPAEKLATSGRLDIYV